MCEKRYLQATYVDWKNIIGFSPDEFKGKLHTIDAELIYNLSEFRKLLNTPVYISPSTWGTHRQNSYHLPKKGRNLLCWALDIFPTGSLLYAFHIAKAIKGFGGIGVYPFWGWKDKKLQGGLHLDIREYDKIKSLWWYNGVSGKGAYNSLYSVDEYLDMCEVCNAIGEQK